MESMSIYWAAVASPRGRIAMSGRSAGLLSKCQQGYILSKTKTRHGRFGVVKIPKQKMRKT